ncbi:hypothetical protein MICABA_00295 [Microbacterium sp. T2.11-28]|nr:hypothetical protein MICABA_00295 [Microbacterium sp. T2.11-28]
MSVVEAMFEPQEDDMTPTPTIEPAQIDAGAPQSAGALRLLPVADRLWRVVESHGRVIGHLQVRGDRAQRRFVALRFHAGDRRFREVGAFWTRAEALECLRLSR